jgi:hypothetical protein
MRYTIVLIFSLFISVELTTAQDFYGNILNIPVEMDDRQLTYPFTGGMNNPQPNEIDLNRDGLMDLFIFDRAGRVGLPFIKELTAEGFRYRYAPSYARYFPEDIGDWVILRDYDGDGVMDLFTNSQQKYAVQGVMVYKGSYTSNRIAFKQFDFNYPQGPEVIPITLLNGSITQLYISNVDYPAIDDMDCDGDLDILTFNVAGGKIELYANRSIEEGYGTDSLIFELVDACWGGVFETSIMPDLLLSGSADTCVTALMDQQPLEERHPGSTLLTMDVNGNGIKDLLLGDITYSSLNMLINSGNCEDAWINEQDAAFPSYDVSVNLPVFPVSFYVDVNNDGVEDLLVAPNAVNGSENYSTIWYYQNTNTVDEPVFEFRQNNLFTENMLDFGTGSRPVFFDYNADGLLDLVVGTDGYFETLGNRDTRLFLLENVGTSTSPAFKLVDNDYLSLSMFDAIYGFAPAFGDIDNDGDEDIIVGENSGKLFFAENTAGPGNPAVFGNWVYPYKDIDVGQFSSPAIADLDRDGLPDLIIGEQNNNLNFLKNVGTANAPDFISDHEAAPNRPTLGNVNFSVPPALTGYGAPKILDQNGTYIMIAGSFNKGLLLYNDIEGNLDGTFSLNAENLGEISIGRRSSPAIADIDNDGKLEMIVGGERGGLNAFQTGLTLDSTTPSVEASSKEEVKIFPNPASNVLNLQFETTANRQLSIYNSTGQLMRQIQLSTRAHQVNTSGFPVGLYLLEILHEGGRSSHRIIIE